MIVEVVLGAADILLIIVLVVVLATIKDTAANRKPSTDAKRSRVDVQVVADKTALALDMVDKLRPRIERLERLAGPAQDDQRGIIVTLYNRKCRIRGYYRAEDGMFVAFTPEDAVLYQAYASTDRGRGRGVRGSVVVLGEGGNR